MKDTNTDSFFFFDKEELWISEKDKNKEEERNKNKNIRR